MGVLFVFGGDIDSASDNSLCNLCFDLQHAYRSERGGD